MPDPALEARARTLAETAAVELAKGHWARAEMAARESLLDWPNPIAENVLGKLALEVGRPDVAIAALERALAIDGRFKPAQRNLSAARRLAEAQAKAPPPDQAGSPASRFLLIRGWGYGFWADVDHVIGALLLAEITGRTPVVHWGPESLWGEPDEAAAGADAWSPYFEPVFGAAIEAVEAAARSNRAGGAVYPPSWSAANLRQAPAGRWEGPWSRLPALRLMNRPEPVVVSDFHVATVGLLPWLPVGHRLKGEAGGGADFAAAHRDLFARYLRPRAEIVAEAEAFVRERLAGGGKAVAVHVRGTDKGIESAHLKHVRDEYPRRIDELLAREPDLRIFLMTDDEGAKAALVERFRERVACMDAARATGQTGVHYLRHASRTRLGAEVLRDVLAAARCRWLIGLGSSNVTLAAWHMKAWPEGAVQLLDRPLHSYVSPVLFERS